MKTNCFDIGIVGAGPAGSSAAISLARKGYSVVLVDKSTFPRSKLCGDFLNPINWPFFKGMGIAKDVLSLKPERITSFRLSTFLGHEASLPFPAQNDHSIFGLGLERSAFDNLLITKAEQVGAVIMQGFRPSGLRQEKDGWCMMLGSRSTEQRVRSTFLIGADGRNSWVARRLGLTQLNPRLERYLAFQTHLRSVQGDKGKVEIHIFPGGYAGLARIGGGISNLCFVVERELATGHQSIEALMERCLFQNPFLYEILKNSEIVGSVHSASPVYFSPRCCYGAGFLLVGDAARVVEPVTGEGIYFALKGGALASEATHQAFCRTNFSARQLSSYGRSCQRTFFFRQQINTFVRYLIYRPRLLAPLIRLSSRSSFPLAPLVNFVCQPGSASRF